MKPSEALLEGAKKAKQIKHEYLRMEDGETCACAMGMIALGAGYPKKGHNLGVLRFILDKFPSLNYTVLTEVMNWNDEDNMPPQDIAERLKEMGY